VHTPERAGYRLAWDETRDSGLSELPVELHRTLGSGVSSAALRQTTETMMA